MNGPSLFRRTLLAISVAAAGASAAPVSAATIVVTSRSLPPGMRITGADFTVDEKTGRARIEVDTYDDSWEGTLSSEPVVVPGLRFDREHREVLYESEGSVITCARPRKFLGSTSYPAAGACRINVRSEPRNEDANPERRAWKDWTNWVVELVTDSGM